MRSSFLTLAVLVASVIAVPTPDDCNSVQTLGNTVIEYYDVVVTKTVYAYAESTPAYVEATHQTHKHKSHTHKHTTTAAVYYSPPPVQTYAPPPPASSPPPTSGGIPSPPTYNGDLQHDILAGHNYFRALHKTGPMTWNQDIADYAAGHTGGCVMQHTGGPYGENLAYGTSLSAAEGMQMWYDECLSNGQDTYDYSNTGFDDSTGHFTQMIWSQSTEVGCYLQQCGGNNYLMCEYAPAGNVIGEFSQYVKPPVASNY